jgi:hypothetical protein
MRPDASRFEFRNSINSDDLQPASLDCRVHLPPSEGEDV